MASIGRLMINYSYINRLLSKQRKYKLQIRLLITCSNYCTDSESLQFSHLR